LLLNFTLEYNIRKVQETQEEVRLNGMLKLLVHVMLIYWVKTYILQNVEKFKYLKIPTENLRGRSYLEIWTKTENNIKMDLEELGWNIRTGFKWFRIWSSGDLL
jgi:hypothetical protein